MLITELGYVALVSALVIAMLQVIFPTIGVLKINLLGKNWQAVWQFPSFLRLVFRFWR